MGGTVVSGHIGSFKTKNRAGELTGGGGVMTLFLLGTGSVDEHGMNSGELGGRAGTTTDSYQDKI